MTFLTNPMDTAAYMLAIKTVLIYLLSTATVATTEVQINICESFDSVAKKLDLQKWQTGDPQSTQFIENTDLELYKQGWIFKIEKGHDPNNLTVILKNNSPLIAMTTKKLAVDAVTALKATKCEYDLHGTDRKLACKMKNKISLQDFNKAVRKNSFKDLLSDEQKKWFKDEGGLWPHNLQITSHFIDQDYTQSFSTKIQEIVLGVTRSKVGQEFIELSTRTSISEDQSAQTELINLLQAHSVQICQSQSSVHTLDNLKSFFGN